MKNTFKQIGLLVTFIFFMGGTLLAQFDREMQYFTYPDQRGLNQFEAPFETDVEFEGVNVRIGGANTLQFQAISQDNSGAMPLPELGSNFNLATSNLDLDVALADGLRMHLRTYLSSQHHPEAWVKGGYLQVDRLDFIKEGLLSDVMDHMRLKIGHMEVNYGDNHFRRTDNGAAILNPFVGNYLMDAFTTEVGGEIYFHSNGFLAMIGVTNGKLNQSVVIDEDDPDAKPALVGKVGYDKQVNDDLRLRLTGSIYQSSESPRIYLYSGDRAGSRYYDVMSGSDFSGRINPGFGNEITAIMINPFVKYKGLEFFGVFESSSGKSVGEDETRNYTQMAGELIYRFGQDDNLYVGGRYNLVNGEHVSGNDISVSRFNVGGGWFITKNVLAKLEYMSQMYEDYPAGSLFEDGEFNGIVLEAVVSF